MGSFLNLWILLGTSLSLGPAELRTEKWQGAHPELGVGLASTMHLGREGLVWNWYRAVIGMLGSVLDHTHSIHVFWMNCIMTLCITFLILKQGPFQF